MSSALIKSDDQYRSWLQEVSKRFRQSQIKAAVHVNAEMLRFYWSLGKDIAAMSESARYGSGFYQSVSTDLKELFPEVHSFSVTNLKYMRYFYELYPEAGNRPQTVDEWRSFQNRQQLVDGMGLESIFLIPWGHHVVLMNACRNNPQKALFYVRKTIENNWSRAVLLNQLDTDLYERQGKAVTNFTLTLPAARERRSDNTLWRKLSGMVGNGCWEIEQFALRGECVFCLLIVCGRGGDYLSFIFVGVKVRAG